jgi:hypothetical protein
MTHPRLTWHQSAVTNRITVKLGSVEAGVILPPDHMRHSNDPNSWGWLFWFTHFEKCLAPSEQAAKDALTARVAEWLRDAGLEQVKETGG